MSASRNQSRPINVSGSNPLGANFAANGFGREIKILVFGRQILTLDSRTLTSNRLRSSVLFYICDAYVSILRVYPCFGPVGAIFFKLVPPAISSNSNWD